MGRGLILWMLGIPLPILIVLWLFGSSTRPVSRFWRLTVCFGHAPPR